LCCFFFSSRRRHTRFSRDWSSDVCSSDLLDERPNVRLHGVDVLREHRLLDSYDQPLVCDVDVVDLDLRRFAIEEVMELLLRVLRSEERRVGKECRSGEWAQHQVEL